MKQIAIIVLVAAALAAVPADHAAAQPDSIQLQGADGAIVIPLQGIAANQRAIQLAMRVQASQRELDAWRSTADPTDSTSVRMAALVESLQSDGIQELGAAYQLAVNSAGPLEPSSVKKVDSLLGLAGRVMARQGSFQTRVMTQISTTVEDAALHYRPYGGAVGNWSSYSGGQMMDVGGYHFRVSPKQSPRFEELLVIIDSPHAHRIAPP